MTIFSLLGVHSTAAYEEIIGKIERLSEIFCYALLVTLEFLMPPALIFTIVNYFIHDLEEESFYLLYPIMYVRRAKTKLTFCNVENDIKFRSFSFCSGYHSIGKHRLDIW